MENQENQTENQPVEETKSEPIAEHAPSATPVEHDVFDAKDIEENKWITCLSYIGLLFLIPLLLKRESAFAQFHAKQGLVLTIVYFVGSFIFWIPLIGWALGFFIFVINVVAFFKCIMGEAWRMPFIYDWSKKINI